MDKLDNKHNSITWKSDKIINLLCGGLLLLFSH